MNNFEKCLCKLYGENALEYQMERYAAAEKEYAAVFGENKNVRIFSAPGRTELCGNHTDHNNGKVLAAAVDLDVIAYAAPTDDGIITIKSEGYNIIKIDCANFANFANCANFANFANLNVCVAEKNTTSAIIKGVAAGFVKSGLSIGGFNAYAVSNVMKGSGVSSSAAFEVLIGTILSGLYNNGSVTNVKIAQIAQYAENEYFGKPSGLMDQMASSVGGFVMIDFMETDNPLIYPIDFDFASSGYTLCLVDTRGSHADLTGEYAAIPNEMKAAAKYFGKSVLREVDEEKFREAIPELRTCLSDRAILRALHFFDENKRVDGAAVALKCGDINGFINTLKCSGKSSFMYLQNVSCTIHPEEQALALGIYAAEDILRGSGMVRVHGGGFAGTIQAIVPNCLLESFKNAQNSIFGDNSCIQLYIRPVGGTEIPFLTEN